MAFGALFRATFAENDNLINMSFYMNRGKGHKQQSSAIAKLGRYKNVHGTMPQGLLKRFEEFKNAETRPFSARNAFHENFKAKS